MTGLIAKGQTGSFTAVAGAWASTPPISNLGTMQIPVPYAQVEPASNEIEFDYTADSAFDCDVIALLAHDLPVGAEITASEGSTPLAQLTVTDQRINNAVMVLPSPVNLAAISINVTGVTTGAVTIGGFFAGRAFYGDFASGWQSVHNSASIVERVALTVWGTTRRSGRVIDYTIHNLTEDRALGTGGGYNIQDLFAEVGNTQPVMVIPSASSQSRIDKLHIYGTLDSGASAYHEEGLIFGARFTAVEMR